MLLFIQNGVKHSHILEHCNIRYLNWNFRAINALVILVSVVRASSWVVHLSQSHLIDVQVVDI